MTGPGVRVEMPGSPSPILLPAGWSVLREGDPLVVIGPEKDLKIAFSAEPLAGAVEELVLAAWRTLEPGFDVPVRGQAELPATDGWEKNVQIVYDTPANQDRLAMAIVRTLHGRAYINLIDSTKAALSRRLAQIGEITNAWKPEGLREPSLAGIAPRPFGEEQRRAMSEFIAASIGRLQIPGAAVAVVQDGRTVYAEGFGVRREGGREAVTPETRFMIGSSTKPLTTLMMARLVDLGYFSWNTKVTEVLPDFALADAEVTRRLEMRHTVCACTGMPRRDTEMIFRFRGVRPEDRLAEMRHMMPTTGFGETFQYSNYLVAAGGFAAAHAFAPEASLADAYERAMQQLVFDPLGMRQTAVFHNYSAEDAAPHARDLHGRAVPFDPELEHFADSVAPAGSVWSSVLDMASYVRCDLRRGANDAGEPVVSEENLLARRRSAIKIDGRNSYGLGLGLSEQQGLSEVSHGGNTRGFTADMLFLPHHGIGMVVLTNMRAANLFLTAIHQRLLELVFGAASKAEAIVAGAVAMQKDFAERTRRRLSTDPASTAWLGRWAGRFACEELGTASISRTESGYRIDFDGWSSDLGVEEQSSDSRQIVLTTPPCLGVFQFRTSGDPDALFFDGAQIQYKFSRLA